MAGMFDFNANVDPADPSSREAMLMRQKVALALMARDRKGYPKTFGEGLTAVGDALAEVGQTRSAERSLAAYEKYQKEHPGPTAADLLPKTSDAGDATARPAVASDETTPAPVETAETPPPQVSPIKTISDNRRVSHQRRVQVDRFNDRSPQLQRSVLRILQNLSGTETRVRWIRSR